MWLPEKSHDDPGIFWGIILGWKMSFHYTDEVIFRVYVNLPEGKWMQMVVSIGLGLF